MRNDDIFGSKSGSLKRGIQTKRALNPLSPIYELPGHRDDEATPNLPTSAQILKMSQNERKELLMNLRSSNAKAGADQGLLSKNQIAQHLNSPPDLKPSLLANRGATHNHQGNLSSLPAAKTSETTAQVDQPPASLVVESLRPLQIAPTPAKREASDLPKQTSVPRLFPEKMLKEGALALGSEGRTLNSRRSMPVLEKRTFKPVTYTPAKFQKLTAHEKLNQFLK